MKHNIRQLAPRGQRPLNFSYEKKNSRQKVTVWVGLVGNGFKTDPKLRLHHPPKKTRGGGGCNQAQRLWILQFDTVFLLNIHRRDRYWLYTTSKSNKMPIWLWKSINIEYKSRMCFPWNSWEQLRALRRNLDYTLSLKHLLIIIIFDTLTEQSTLLCLIRTGRPDLLYQYRVLV